MMDVFVVRDPSCSLAFTARPLVASSVPSYNLWDIAVVVLGISLLPIAGSWLRSEASVFPFWSAIITVFAV